MMYSIHHFCRVSSFSSKTNKDQISKHKLATQEEMQVFVAPASRRLSCTVGEVRKIAGGTPALRNACLREEHVEARAAGGVVLQADRATMVVHDLRDDRK